MKKNNKIVSCSELMHSLFVKGILITGLALATQNVMAKEPPCNKQRCCVENTGSTSDCVYLQGPDKVCEVGGLANTCLAVVNCCNYH